MSDGTGTPGEWADRPASPGQQPPPPAGPGGAQNQQQPGTPGQAPQGPPPVGGPVVPPPAPVPPAPAPYPGAPQPVPPAPGGFGPPPASYGPPVPAPQPAVPSVPTVPQPPVPQPQPPQPQPPVPQPPAHVQPPAPRPVHHQHPPVQPQPPVHPQPVQPQHQWQQPQPPQPQPPAQHAEPDWAALADRNEAEAKRKGRTRIIGAAVALLVVGGLVAGGLLFMNKGDGEKPVAEPTPSGTAATQPPPAPTASGKASPTATASATPEDPSKPLWEATTDPAPQDAAALFSALTVTVNGATWNRTVVSLDSPCWDGNSTVGGLGKILGDQGCRQVLRATYVSGDSAVTVGVAVFDHKQQAEAAVKNYVGHLKGAAAPGSPAFCTTPGCTNTKGTLGRYGFFTVEGSAKGGNTADAAATAAAVGFDEHVKSQLLQRTKAAAGAPAATPAG